MRRIGLEQMYWMAWVDLKSSSLILMLTSSFFNVMGFSTGQANFSADITGKVQVITERFYFLVFGGGFQFCGFFVLFCLFGFF